MTSRTPNIKRLDSHSLRQRWKPKIFPFFNSKMMNLLLLLFWSSIALSLEVDGGDLGSSNLVTKSKTPPQFASVNSAGVQPTQIWLDEREKLNLKCPLQTNASFIQWLKDGKQLRDESALFLDMPVVSRLDSGLYRCYAENEFGSLYSWPINVTVLYLDGFVTDTISVLTVPELGNFVLKPPALKASSNVNLSWRWFYQDNEITSNNDYYITLSGSLVVGSPLQLSGNYTVQVKASNGPSFFHNFAVETDRDPRKVSEFRMLYQPTDSLYIHGRAHPFTLHAGDLQGLAGTPSFECVPSMLGKHPAAVRWSLNGDPLVAEVNGVHIEERGRRLILMNARQFFAPNSHSAIITCRAQTALSELIGTAQLNMIEVPKINRKLFDGQRSIPLGSALRLKCKADGAWPRAKISWFFNGKKIPNTMSTDVLKIDGIQEQNYGVYQCEASNSAGSDIASLWVRRPATKSSDDFLAQNDDGDLPSTVSQFKFIQSIEDRNVPAGSDITLQCITNDPENTKLTWKYSGEQIVPNTHYQINKTSLNLHGVKKGDAGVYECEATNVVTEESLKAKAELTIRGSSLIEYGPSNQSVLIGTNIRMPCKISDEILSHNSEIRPEWSRNVS